MKNVAEFAFSTGDGGIETLIKDYMLIFDKNKINPVFIVARRINGSANDAILKNSGAKVISIYKHSSFFFKVIQRFNRWWYIPYQLKKILKQENIDILHTHFIWLHYIKKLSRYFRQSNIKLFYTCHCGAFVTLGNSLPMENRAAEYLIKNNNLKFIALHNDMRRDINEIFGIDNTIVIRNGIDFKRFRNISESREDILKKIGISENAYVIGHVGSFLNVKNHIFLVDIFVEICKRKDNAFLLMIGAGALMSYIVGKLNSYGLNGKYLVLSHRSDIPQLMKAMDVFVFPSLYEGLPVALVEAQVSGIRCVISDTINEETILSENTVAVSLNKSASEWCDIILDNSIKSIPHGNIDEYDMNTEIKKLEKLYLGELKDE